MKIALAQILSTSQPAQNLELVRQYSSQAKAQGAHLVLFPEATMCAFGNDLRSVAEELDGPWATAVRQIAQELDIAIVVGMFTPGDGNRIRNTLLVAGPGVDTHYDKMHLFDAFGFKESASVAPGERAVTFTLDGAIIGLATCYDVRFPTLFTTNAVAGATINLVSASWGSGPGKVEQWELVTRARAVDSTTFVVAVGQADPVSVGQDAAGTTPLGVGHSAVISPLGQVLVSMGPAPELLVFELDLSEVDRARQALPVLANARSL